MKIPENYPFGSTEEEISNIIKNCSAKIAEARDHNNYAINNFGPVIMLGQNELQKRSLEKSSKDTSRKTCITIVLAIIAIGVSCWSSCSSDKWQKEQVPILKKINLEIKRENKLLNNLFIKANEKNKVMQPKKK